MSAFSYTSTRSARADVMKKRARRFPLVGEGM